MLVLFSHLLSNSGKPLCARVSAALSHEWSALSSEERKTYPKEGKNPESRKKRKHAAEVTLADDEYHRETRRRSLWSQIKKLVKNLLFYCVYMQVESLHFVGVTLLVFSSDFATEGHQYYYYDGPTSSKSAIRQFVVGLESSSLVICSANIIRGRPGLWCFCSCDSSRAP